ncbi:MAG TPA: PQQ-binding-like beta-propeller repeat protein [Pyrinomonadaceae bacterium]|nr:PQQ-binding-like beta-propeller repeat protein [Pyrinomonadaceae bacterium]
MSRSKSTEFTPSRILRSFVAMACFFLAIVPLTSAQDWGQWRGPERNGLVPASHTPKAWPASLQRVWRVETGEGYASPLVSKGRVFVHSRQDPEEIVTAIDYATGKQLWQQKYPAPFTKNQYAVKMAKGPNATPLVAGNRLFTLGVTGVLNAWDTSSGKLLWTKDFSKTVDTSKLFCGTAASPLFFNGLVVIQVGSDVHGGQILALDPATGASRWEWRGAGPGYASPTIIDVAGGPQLVAMTEGSMVGLDSKGAELWSVPFADEWHENIVTPIWTGTHLIVSGPRQGTHAYSLAQTGGKWQATEVWKNADVTMYMSSPVYGDGLIYGLSEKRKGQFVALDAKTGVVRWITEGREGEHASVMLTPSNLVYLTNNADLIVARRGTTKFEVDKRYDVAESATWAAPVFLGTDLLIRDASGLMRLTAGK